MNQIIKNELQGRMVEEMMLTYFPEGSIEKSSNAHHDIVTKKKLIEVKSTHIKTIKNHGRFLIVQRSHILLHGLTLTQLKSAYYLFVLLNEDNTISQFRMMPWASVDRILQNKHTYTRKDGTNIYTIIQTELFNGD